MKLCEVLEPANHTYSQCACSHIYGLWPSPTPSLCPYFKLFFCGPLLLYNNNYSKPLLKAILRLVLNRPFWSLYIFLFIVSFTFPVFLSSLFLFPSLLLLFLFYCEFLLNLKYLKLKKGKKFEKNFDNLLKAVVS